MSLVNYSGNLPPAPYTPVVGTRPQAVRTAAARVSVCFGILSICFGVLLFIPVIAIVTGIVALVRGTALTGRAITGLILGLQFGAIWFAIWCLFIYGYNHS